MNKPTSLSKVKLKKSKLEKDYIDLLTKITYAKEKNTSLNKIGLVLDQIENVELKNERLFALSHFRESQLKSYHTEIRSRAYMTPNDHDKAQDKADDAIHRIAEENIRFIKKIQEYIGLELDQTKRELEYDSIEKFQENIKRQDEALYKIVQSEKAIFDRTTASMDRIAEIKDNFANLNDSMQKQIEDNRLLKIKYDILQYENKSIKRMLKEQMRNNETLLAYSNNNTNDQGKESQNKEDVVTQSNDTASNIKTTTQTQAHHKGYGNRINLKMRRLPTASAININRPIKSYNRHQRNHTECGFQSSKVPGFGLLSHMGTESSGTDLLHHFDTNSNLNNDQVLSITNSDMNTITMRIREMIKTGERHQLQRLVRNNKLKGKRNNMIQLLKKCIEDFSYDYSLLCSSHNTQSRENKAKAKEKCTKELELITYIYDNWFRTQDNKSKMGKSQSCRLKVRRK